MKNSGLKNEAQVAKIFVSGSDALPQTNDSGVRLFKESDLTDGIISGKLTRPNYNTKELKKSVDTTIFELLPNNAPIDIPRIPPASSWPLFCQSRYELYSTQNWDVSSASPDAKRFRFSILIASSRYGSTIAKFTAPCIVPATNPETRTIAIK